VYLTSLKDVGHIGETGRLRYTVYVLPIPGLRIKEDTMHKVTIVVCCSEKRHELGIVSHSRSSPRQIAIGVLDHGEAAERSGVLGIKGVLKKPPGAEDGDGFELAALESILGNRRLVYRELSASVPTLHGRGWALYIPSNATNGTAPLVNSVAAGNDA
jgi:hypothetical protein